MTWNHKIRNQLIQKKNSGWLNIKNQKKKSIWKFCISRFSEKYLFGLTWNQEIPTQRHRKQNTGWQNIKNQNKNIFLLNSVFRVFRKNYNLGIPETKNFSISVIENLILVGKILKIKKKIFFGKFGISRISEKCLFGLTWNQEIPTQRHRKPNTGC